jgi:hypothetical protein
MSNYEVKGADESGQVVVVATVDTATLALVKLRDALATYRRVWVKDASGGDVSLDELLARSGLDHSCGWGERLGWRGHAQDRL